MSPLLKSLLYIALIGHSERLFEMQRTLCERVAEPLLRIHGKTTPPVATVLLGAIGLCVGGYGIANGHRDVAWAGLLIAVVAWYGFLLCGCYRLVENNQ